MKHIKTFEDFVNESKMTLKQLATVRKGDIVVYRGKSKNGFEKDHEYPVKSTSSNSTFQPSVVIELKPGGKTLKITNPSDLFTNHPDDLHESNINEQTMTIAIFSDEFSNFYDFINKHAKDMDKNTITHIKEAIKHLDKAWENEAHDHGVDFEKKQIKL